MTCKRITRSAGKVVYEFEEGARRCTVTLYYLRSMLAEGVQEYLYPARRRRVIRLSSYDPGEKHVVRVGDRSEFLLLQWERIFDTQGELGL